MLLVKYAVSHITFYLACMALVVGLTVPPAIPVPFFWLFVAGSSAFGVAFLIPNGGLPFPFPQ